MRVLLQRVSRASVRIAGEEVGAVGRGYLLLVGFADADGPATVEWMADKVGEEFEDGRSWFDFSPAHVRASVERSLARLRTGDDGGPPVHSPRTRPRGARAPLPTVGPCRDRPSLPAGPGHGADPHHQVVELPLLPDVEGDGGGQGRRGPAAS